jgi:hypothetical protein
MRINRRLIEGSILFTAIACSLLPVGALPSFADDTTTPATSGTPTLSGTATSSGKGELLHSSLQDQENMQSSVKLLVAPPPTPKPPPPVTKPFVSNVEQFSGDAQKGGTPITGIINQAPRILQGGAQNGFKPPPMIVPQRILPFFRPAAPVPRWNFTATPRNGTMIWDPNYAIKRIPQAPVRRNLNLTLSAPNTTNVQLSSPSTSIRRIDMPDPTPAPPPPPPALKAVQYEIPEARLPAPANWDEWYRRVAKAVYEQWKQKAIGPGKSTLTVTVYNGHNVDAKVVEFIPAEGANRDGKTESTFREASIMSVTNLDGLPLWEFPVTKPVTKKIAFDMEFDHIVGEPAGVQVIRRHAN